LSSKIQEIFERYLDINKGISAGVVSILAILASFIYYGRWEAAEITFYLFSGTCVVAVGVRGGTVWIAFRDRLNDRLNKVYLARLSLLEQEFHFFISTEMQEAIKDVQQGLAFRKRLADQFGERLKVFDVLHKGDTKQEESE